MVSDLSIHTRGVYAYIPTLNEYTDKNVLLAVRGQPVVCVYNILIRSSVTINHDNYKLYGEKYTITNRVNTLPRNGFVQTCVGIMILLRFNVRTSVRRSTVVLCRSF